MKWRLRIFIFTLSAALIGILLYAGLREPWYHLRPLSSWLSDYDGGPRGYKPSPDADNALRRIGSNAVPCVLRLLHTTNAYSGYAFVRKENPPEMIIFPATTLAGRVKAIFEKFPFRFRRVVVPASWNHWKAYVALQVLGPEAKSAIPDLSKLARDDPNGTSFYPNIYGMKNIAWTALSADNSSTYVAPGDSSSFHGSELLRSTNSFLVDGEIAAWSLAAIGRDAVPSLMELLADPNPRLKQRAIEALGMIGADAEPAVPALVECLKNPDGDVRMRSADALGWIGCRPDLAIPPLVDALNDSDIGVEYYAAESLGRFGKSATNAIPALLKSFADRDYRIRQSAATALSKISPEITEKEVVPVLFHQLDDPNAWHNGALMDLLQLNLKPDVLIPHLIKALDDSDGSDKSIQVNAIRALGKFGPAAKEAVPKLIRLQTDENPFVRQEITNALKQIEPNHF